MYICIHSIIGIPRPDKKGVQSSSQQTESMRMRERVHGLGGRFELASSPGLGVCVRAWLPIHEEPAT